MTCPLLFHFTSEKSTNKFLFAGYQDDTTLKYEFALIVLKEQQSLIMYKIQNEMIPCHMNHEIA